MDENEEVKIDAKLETYHGVISFNVLDIIKNLDDDKKKELLSDGGWWNLVSEKMAFDIIEEFSRDNYNEVYTKLRTAILNSEAMPQLIKEWAVAMLHSRERAKESEQYWDRAYWKLYHYTREKLGNADDFPRLPDRYFNTPYSQELLNEVNKKAEEFGELFP